MNISFFANPLYLGSRIRGEQVAQWLGGKYNPRSGYENDVCVHIKPQNMASVRDGDWVDISDGPWVPDLLSDRPGVGAIANSKHSYDFLSKKLPNKLVWISTQHLNWERVPRRRVQISTCGYIGNPSLWTRKVYDQLGGALKEAGWEFVTRFEFQSRQACIDFYLSIDLLIVGPAQTLNQYKTPTKLINAASFGIPSIAQQVPGYLEWEGNYLIANDIPSIVEAAEKFKDKSYYESWAARLPAASDPYHIGRVIERYGKLS